MVENVTQIKSGITINVDVDVNIKIWVNIKCVTKTVFRILVHVVVKMVNI